MTSQLCRGGGVVGVVRVGSESNLKVLVGSSVEWRVFTALNESSGAERRNDTHTTPTACRAPSTSPPYSPCRPPPCPTEH
ncbi:hypothetical protein E2C01_045933 [Portunus trituberculatus]|uniref:Uncharacterized protein n=1 Tax=Portunus trituberculatus TaxID=210409 RepID=A0A5B7G6A8_PORTR|nr:hypothetical protein [Portunus trituberculatus]